MVHYAGYYGIINNNNNTKFIVINLFLSCNEREEFYSADLIEYVKQNETNYEEIQVEYYFFLFFITIIKLNILFRLTKVKYFW